MESRSRDGPRGAAQGGLRPGGRIRELRTRTCPIGRMHAGRIGRDEVLTAAGAVAGSTADSSPETSASCGLRAVRISSEAPRLLVSSCILASGIVNQRPFGARGLSMRGETIRERARERRPGTRPRHRAGPPRETPTHATRAFRFGSQNGVRTPQNANAPAVRPGRSLLTCWRASFARARQTHAAFGR